MRIFQTCPATISIVGETRVDLLHLLEDLADAYPGELEETVLTEIVANALDSGARTIRLIVDAAGSTLTAVDDGKGMRRAELRRFHDVAASTKARGDGIGFAGVGIKLGLLLCEEVLTETRRGREHVATTWSLANRKRAPWRWVEPPGLVAEQGTAVRLRPSNALSPLLDAGYVEGALRRHFAPLFDPFFDELLESHYGHPVRFEIDGRSLAREGLTTAELAPVSVRLARKRKPAAVGYLVRHDAPLPPDERGIAIATLGKVIKRGWDWLGLTPAAAERVSGIIEAPALAATLTLNKADFLRSGARGATYLAYRKALQQAVSEQLASWGDVPESGQRERRRSTRPLERDVATVLADLSEQFPLLSALVERRPGGDRKLPTSERNGHRGNGVAAGAPLDLFAEPTESDEGVADSSGEPSATPGEAAESAPEAGGTPGDVDDLHPPGEPEPPKPPTIPPAVTAGTEPPGRRTRRRPMRLGLSIDFESRVGDPELGRLVETTVWVNVAHPAFQRASASRSEGYHVALSVAMALSGIAVEPGEERSFVMEFLSAWGESATRKDGGRRKSRKRK